MLKILQDIENEARHLEASLRMQNQRGKKLDPWDHFKSQQETYYTKQIIKSKEKLNLLQKDYEKAIGILPEYEQLLNALKQLKTSEDQHSTVMQIQELALQLQPKRKTLTNLPDQIQGEVEADIQEMYDCFDYSLFRSAVILCGRILETCLHRKYYEKTQNDLLEKAPGIGLGKIIAKLKEENINFPPGMTEQIHLINQARITTVHKKQQPFQPSKEQAQAIILYTMDVVKKLF